MTVSFVQSPYDTKLMTHLEWGNRSSKLAILSRIASTQRIRFKPLSLQCKKAEKVRFFHRVRLSEQTTFDG